MMRDWFESIKKSQQQHTLLYLKTDTDVVLVFNMKTHELYIVIYIYRIYPSYKLTTRYINTMPLFLS